MKDIEVVARIEKRKATGVVQGSEVGCPNVSPVAVVLCKKDT